MKQVLNLFICLVILTSCNGQGKPPVQNEKDTTMMGQDKLPLPKGANKEVRIGTSMEDWEGNLWFGSIGEGLFKFDGKLFRQYGMEQGLSSNNIYSLLQDNTGTIWVGTNKGLNRFDGNKFERVAIVFSNTSSTSFTNNNTNNTSTENTVWCMMQDKNGTLWFGTDEGVYCYDGNMFSRFLDKQSLYNKDHLNLKGIFSIIETKNGSIWFAECAGEGV
ncbi:MAG: hypothetical protein CFE21_09305 [Bacteroidetes bacterium B1(2017)]|nr:MAG: hypothetical protein CFE21_09305 [Bacteroidetes bacterium B1(2017)]